MDYSLRRSIAICSKLVAQLRELEQLRDRVRRAQLAARKIKRPAGSRHVSEANFRARPVSLHRAKISAANRCK